LRSQSRSRCAGRESTISGRSPKLVTAVASAAPCDIPRNSSRPVCADRGVTGLCACARAVSRRDQIGRGLGRARANAAVPNLIVFAAEPQRLCRTAFLVDRRAEQVCFIFRTVAFDTRIAAATCQQEPSTSAGSLFTSTMSQVSTATSPPVPMAMPRFACASAGASFTPSPSTLETCWTVTTYECSRQLHWQACR
jgi:hypothetical protein